MLPTAALGRGFSRGFGPRQWIVNAQPAEGDTRTDLVVIVDECFDHHATHAKPNDPNDPNDQTDVSDQTDLSTGVDSLTATALAAGIGCS